MKIHFDNVNFSSSSGPNSFAGRLATQLFGAGHEVITSAKDADVSLVFIERSGAPVATRVIQRLDGIWFKPEEYERKNVGIKSLYLSADAVIWQSDFDKNMTTKWWNYPKSGTVIHNGIALVPVRTITSPELRQLRADFDKVYVCSSNWHPQKRLRDNIELFKRLYDINLAKTGKKSCLIVMGANPDVGIASPYVFYTGSLSHDLCLQVYSLADWMIHLAYADHCPNVVVEALGQGTPVICASTGGTKELIGSYGIVIDDDIAYDYSLLDYDNPPRVNIERINDLLPDRRTLDYSSIADIDIVNVSNEYVKLFERMIKCD